MSMEDRVAPEGPIDSNVRCTLSARGATDWSVLCEEQQNACVRANMRPVYFFMQLAIMCKHKVNVVRNRTESVVRT